MNIANEKGFAMPIDMNRCPCCTCVCANQKNTPDVLTVEFLAEAVLPGDGICAGFPGVTLTLEWDNSKTNNTICVPAVNVWYGATTVCGALLQMQYFCCGSAGYSHNADRYNLEMKWSPLGSGWVFLNKWVGSPFSCNPLYQKFYLLIGATIPCCAGGRTITCEVTS